MKFLIIFFFLTSCASKTEYYLLLDKSQFLKERTKTAYHQMSEVKGKPHYKSYCRGQFLFFSNADKETERQLKSHIRYACPGKDYLLEAKVQRLWWTTLIYTRSCIDLRAYCPR